MTPKERKEQAIKEQQRMLDTAKAEGRELSEIEVGRFEELQKEIDSEEGEPKKQNEKSAEEIRKEERQRASEITGLCREFDLDAATYIDGNKSVETVKNDIIAQIRQENKPISARGILDVGTDEEDKYRSAVADALVMRGGVTIEKPAEGSKDFASMSLRDLAIETLQKAGEGGLNRKSSDELFGMLNSRAYYNPASSFTAIMDTAINKAYVEGHKKAAVTFDRFTKKGTLRDFKTHDNNYLAGPAGEFLEVPEGGELKHDSMVDEKRPTRKLKTYGRQFTMTRQAFINDDIDFLSKIPAKYAASARKTINKQVFQIMINNPVIYDGQKVFSTEHKNLLAQGTGVTAVSVQKMFMALQMQKDEFGEAIIIRPATIVVPIGYSFDMYTLFYSPTINTSANTQASNPLYQYRESIEVIEDPTINVLAGAGRAMPWFIIGARDDTDFIEVDYLNGQETPTIRRMEQAGTLGFVWDIFLDWGITVIDYRGAIKNTGITVLDPLA